ncbi:MAG: hypothetical protein M3Y21_09945 [Candidatus Eremiobacteraeota bacterium]|nr:hypothetical protein [Candidatus Eremiobacteraeota bacterium]
MISLAIALAIIEIVAGGWPPLLAPAPTPPEKVTIARLVRIEHRPTPAPRPTPKPTPPPIVHIHPVFFSTPRPVPKIVNPAPKKALRTEGAAAPTVRIHRSKHSVSVPVWDRGGAIGAGHAGHGTGGGSTGTGGNGEGGVGNGNGGPPAANEPCGFVEFININTPKYDKRTGGFYQDIRMVVNFPDGSNQAVNLDYQFYWPSEAAFPFSDRNIGSGDPIPMQLPPADKAVGEPPLVQYVLKHTTPDGLTLLKDCPAK